MSLRQHLAAVLLAAAPLWAQAPDLARPDFARQVRPVLAEHCFPCHGPDPGGRKAGLRLDSFEAATAERKGGVRPIVPGDVAHSAVLLRLDSDDAAFVMPPPAAHRPTTAAERQLLRQWIAGGAKYAPHWSLLPPKKQLPPAVDDGGWCRDEIDRFVLAALQHEGRQPSPPAEPAVLLRRAALVLTGLPPTPADVAAFAADTTANAYERRVAAMLATPACAEHLATTWLDLARFADTYGYQSDFECRTWPWRDWLIAAFAADMPYDEFVRQLVAGDLLPAATPESTLATAFFRLHRQTNEGGSIDEEWRQEYIADRVDTLGTALLGLTVGCARCHDHKFDPITTRDYYALGSFFAIDDSGLYPYSTGATPRPSLRLATPAQRAAIDAQRQTVAAAEGRVLAARTAAMAAAQRANADAAAAELPPPLARYAFDAVADGKTPDARRGDQPATVAAGVSLVEGKDGKALQFDGDGGVVVPGVPAFGRDDAYSLAFCLWCPDRKQRAVVVHTSSYTEDADTQGYQVLLEDGRLCWQIAHYWPGSAIALRARDELPLQRWLHVVVTYDGSSRADGMAIFVDGRRADVEVVRDHLDGAATVHTLQLGARDRDRGLLGGRLDEFAVYDRCLDAFEVARLDGATVGATVEPESLAQHCVDADRGVAAARSEVQQARKALHAIEEAIPEIMVLGAHPAPPPRFVLKRGAYDQPDKSRPVRPDVPAAVLPFDSSLPRTRLGLAAWLTSPQQPLVARVAVNRLWAQCFGQGLVRTTENFGQLGEAPALPDLLDALAVDFVAGGFRNKAMLRRIVTSATFRQSSAASLADRERDPDNRLYGRGPAFRLGAEVLRDQALAAAGLLQTQVGGPSCKPWQPPGLWRDSGVAWGGADYKPDDGANAHRRSLYTYRKRTAPPPDMQALDAPSREFCSARRQVTDTPLQALVFLDDPVFVECAEAVAVAAQQAGADADARCAAAFVRLCARPPRPAETAALRTLYDNQLAAFTADADACKKVLHGADPDPGRAALVLLCSTLLASDEVMVLR